MSQHSTQLTESISEATQVTEGGVLHMIRKYLRWEISLTVSYSAILTIYSLCNYKFSAYDDLWRNIFIFALRVLMRVCLYTLMWRFLNMIFYPYELFYHMCKEEINRAQAKEEEI